MAWTQTGLVTAFNALSPAPATLAAAAAALNAQTGALASLVTVQAVAAYLASQGKLASFMAWAASPPSGASAGSITAANELAFAFEHPQLIPNFDMTNSVTAAAVSTWLSDLVLPGNGVSGPITSTDQAALLALGTPSVAAWQPAVQISDLQIAQRAGLISSEVAPYSGYVQP